MIAFWAVVIAAIWALFRLARVEGRDRTARGALDERYACGEIGNDEYRTRRAELRH